MESYPPHSIAVVGMAGRFPGAESVQELWHVLAEGRSMVERAPVKRLNLPEARPGQDLKEPHKKWWGNFLRDPHSFDHRFFSKSSREAVTMDPHLRVLLQVSYEALESSGYFCPSEIAETDDYGCFIGLVLSDYYNNLNSHSPNAYSMVGAARPFVSGSVSHHFHWTGPTMTIDSACSSSLVAINAACRAIWSGECSRALAGGVNIISNHQDYLNLDTAGFLSPTGQCKPFDSNSDGYCRGEAVGVVILKPLADAVQAHDDILGVIVGSAVNQCRNNRHITVPNGDSQTKLFRKVLELSNVTPEQVSYVEAHGTGTSVGDPIEAHSICDVFGSPERKSPLHFASIKGNIGHSEGCAGVSGLIKVLLMMKNGLIPPQVSLSALSPNMPSLSVNHLAIPSTILPWDAKDRLACINSYGAAGSNCALIVCEAPPNQQPWDRNTGQRKATPPQAHSSEQSFPLIITAATKESISSYCEKLLAQMGQSESISHRHHKEQLPVSSWTFNLARRANHELAFYLVSSVSSIKEMKEKITAAAVSGAGIAGPDSATRTSARATTKPDPIIFVFGGQENDFIGLSKELYESHTIFREHLNACNELIKDQNVKSFFPDIFSTEQMQDVVQFNCALFAVQYASAKAWLACGSKPDGLIGHSFGQLAALCISGALCLQDTITLVIAKASLVQERWGPDQGSMLYVGASRAVVESILDAFRLSQNSSAEIGCYNSPRNHVVVGSCSAIDALEQYIITNLSHTGDRIRTRKLQVSHAFHSKYTELIVPHLAAVAERLTWKSPKVRVELCSDGGGFAIDEEHGFDISTRLLRSPVLFQDGVEKLVEEFGDKITWLEAGRGSSVMKLVQECCQPLCSFTSSDNFLSPKLCSASAVESLVRATVSLWKARHKVQHWSFHQTQRLDYGKIDLPPYEFAKNNKFWVPFSPKGLAGGAEGEATHRPLLPEPVRQLVSVISSTSNSEHLFRIDHLSDRFVALRDGHAMTGQKLAPASLYFEIVVRAAFLLQKNTAASEYVPAVEELSIKSPIIPNASKQFVLGLKPLAIDGRPYWSFSITSRISGTEYAQDKAQKHATGTIQLKKRDDKVSEREFMRYESLVDSRRQDAVFHHPDAEMMQGTHIYRAFNPIVDYGAVFHGIKKIASMGNEVVAKIVIGLDGNAEASQRLCDTPMIENFMQPPGFLFNYFVNKNWNDVFVCSSIDRIEMGCFFDPNAKEWLAYSNMTFNDGKAMSADTYIFEASSRKLIFCIFGSRCVRVSRTSFESTLISAINGHVQSTTSWAPLSQSDAASQQPLQQTLMQPNLLADVSSACAPSSAPRQSSFTSRKEIIKILSKVTDVAPDDIVTADSLEDLGVDSLMAAEILNDFRSLFELNIDIVSFMLLRDIDAVISFIDQQLGFVDSSEKPTPVALNATSPSSQSIMDGSKSTEMTPKSFCQTSTCDSEPTKFHFVQAFEETRLGADELAKRAGALGFWSDVNPQQCRLLVAYVIEAFAELGCDLVGLEEGAPVPRILFQERHAKLVSQLYKILEHEGLILFSDSDGGFTRSASPIDIMPAASIFLQIVGRFPLHDDVTHLIRVVGSRFAACLTGEEDVLKILFGNLQNKKTLENMYEFWPLFRIPILLLGDFLVKAAAQAKPGGKLRILEVGGGTGGTTRYIVSHLRSHGIPFEYVFTDLSSSLVAVARKSFGSPADMSFRMLDMENPAIPEDFRESFHCIIGTSCVHATRNLKDSLRNLRQMLRADGVLALIELVQYMYWPDMVVGLLEGWWLFSDGREHVLADEWHWKQVLKKSGFSHILWSDGRAPESKSMRLICGFLTSPPVCSTGSTPLSSMEIQVDLTTVAYKKIGQLEIFADIYYPSKIEQSRSNQKMPIALMIHGGCHVVFSRKAVRPPQTRLLLEKGFLPVSLDHRLCPEVPLREGAMEDICDGLHWARTVLPQLKSLSNVQPDGERVVVVGWSTGGQLAMSLAWMAPQRSLAPPSAILAFYAPTNYEDACWRKPIQPLGAADPGGFDYDLLEGVSDEPISSYNEVSSWEPLSNPKLVVDPRCRIILHMNWKAQVLPILLDGLPSKTKAASSVEPDKNWYALPLPSAERTADISAHAQVRRGRYRTPTFMVHGTEDELIPWKQSRDTYRAMIEQGLEAHLIVVQGAPHICDGSSDAMSEGFSAVLRGYEFLRSHV